MVLWEDGQGGGAAVKTTVEVSDELYRRAKAEAALRGRKLKDLIEEGLRIVLDTPASRRKPPSLAGLMKKARGAIASGLPDLASNPDHMTGFGRNGRRNR
jgi:hypothetical protein